MSDEEELTPPKDFIASIEIRRVTGMTIVGRRIIAAWLREQADKLERDGDKYAATFTAYYNPIDD